MSTVETIIEGKGHEVLTVQPFVTVLEAIRTMVQHNVGALVVMEDGQPCGILTERDYLRRVALEGRASKSTFVQEIMTPRLIYVEPQTKAEDCMNLMTRHRIRHLVVLRDGKLSGIVSIGDIVKHVAAERAGTIDQLTHYIQGRA